MTATLTCLVGEAVVDGYYRGPGEAPLIRLGGVLHAARGMAAVGRPFAVAYISPSYLDGQVERYARSLGATAVVKIGDVVGCPNVVIVGSPREEGPQGYEFLLREEQLCRLDLTPLSTVVGRGADVLLFPGGFDLQQVLGLLRQLGASVYADAHHGPTNLGEFATLGKPLTGLILSTSSQVFLVGHGADPARLRASTRGPIADWVLLKENRGGVSPVPRGGRDRCSSPRPTGPTLRRRRRLLRRGMGRAERVSRRPSCPRLRFVLGC